MLGLQRQAKPRVLKARLLGKGSGARWALGSLLLHALLLGYAATRQGLVDAAAPLVVVSPAELEVDVVPLPDVAEDAEKSEGAQPATPSAPTVAAGPRGESMPVAGADEATTTDEAAAGEGLEDAASAASPAASDTAPRLGLAELGLTGPNPFLDRSAQVGPARGKRRVNVKKRLDQALSQGLQDQTTALGLGAGSPVMRTLESTVYGSTAPLNGNAMFTFIIDSEGKLVSSSLGEVSSDRDKWERVARQAAQALAQRKLPVPKGRSVKLTVAVTSHLELPSGADPGLEIKALGIPLKKGEGDRSTSISILNPLNPSEILSVMGDPADIAGKARRMVRSHVVSEELL